jgi:hypothetical protein
MAFVVFTLSGVAKGYMDKVRFHYHKVQWQPSIFWNAGDPDMSWLNKYKDRDVSKGPAFTGSTTVFVFLTDGWHLLQFVFLLLIFAGTGIATQVKPIVNKGKYKTFWNVLLYGLLFRGAYQLGFLVYYT